MVTMGVSRLQIILILTIIVIFLLGFKLFTDRDTYKDLYYKSLGSASAGAVLPGQRSNDDVHFTLAQVIQLRNNMSRILNLKQQKIGQMECEVSFVTLFTGGFVYCTTLLKVTVIFQVTYIAVLDMIWIQ